ncbi:hypothetical protein APHAL10511_004052 [Amanita phalloides]|nr:hypothetical protein APHAL10511_004052 [Amanita phalloides]
MIECLLAPELLFFLAFLEWVQSSAHLKKLIRENPACEWTEAHAIFAYTGGFRQVNADDSKTQLRGHDFFTRVFRGEIDIPIVTTECIRDKSKGDWISKAIVVVQTVWFALQVMNRYAQHLPVTELEITTLAHVTLNAFIYWCW